VAPWRRNPIPASIRGRVEALFAHTYLLLFGKLAAGGLLALAVPPFSRMERGFYKSTGVVYLAMAYLMAAGEAYLYVTYRNLDIVSGASLAAWWLFTALFTAYCVTLFIDLPFLRARLFPVAVLAGIVALVATAWGYVPDGASLVAGVPYAASLLAGAAITGASTTGMLLGHWYLIDTGLDLEPLHNMLTYCRACLRLEIVVVVVGAVALYAWPGGPWAASFDLAFGDRFRLLLMARVAAWTLALILAALITRTLAIPQTMAATGLFYIQALVVAVGQICGHWLLFRTGLPL